MIGTSINFNPFIDKFGLVAQKDTAGADGGDSAHRFGLTYSCLKLLNLPFFGTDLDTYYDKAIEQYKVTDELYTRHPDKDKWYSNPKNFSRDQTTMLFKAMLMRGDSGRLRGIFVGILKRFGFHHNVYPNYAKPNDPEYKWKIPDTLTPSEIADALRSYRSVWLYPVISFLDLFKLVDVYLAERDDEISKKKGKRTDYFVMLCMDVAVSRAVQDTFVMRMVAKRLAKTDYKSSIQWIFSPMWDDPPIDKLLIPVCERYIDNAN